MSEDIPLLSDREWQKKNELEKVERVIEYKDAGTEKKVRAIATVPSGGALLTLESEADANTITYEQYNRTLWSMVFGLSKQEIDDILLNKSQSLRMKLIEFANEVCGVNLSDAKIAAQKNLESPNQ